MTFDTEARKAEIRRWSRLAIQLNGVVDTRNYDHITTAVILDEIQNGNVFEFLMRELPRSVWEISKLTDVDRHKLSQHWRQFAEAYEPQQFHVTAERVGAAGGVRLTSDRPVPLDAAGDHVNVEPAPLGVNALPGT